MKIAIFISLSGCLFIQTSAFFYPKPNTEPDTYKGKVVGILSQKTFGYRSKLGDEYLAASYVKFVQSAGAQVVPVLTLWEDKKITDLLGQINGILVPGGDQYIPNSRFYEVVALIYNWAEKYNSERKIGHFPIWGTCLGFESVLRAAANSSLLTNCSANGIPNNLTLLDLAQDSKMLSGLSADVYKAIQTELVVYNSHHNCVPVESFAVGGNKKGALAEKFTLIAVNWDAKGYEYAALAEHVKLPYFVSQFHPEKSGFEWDPYIPIPHSRNSIVFMQYLANVFVSYVNANDNKFTTGKDFYTMSIENFNTIYTLRTMNFSLQSCYFFKKHQLEGQLHF